MKILILLMAVIVAGGCASSPPKYLNPNVQYFGVVAKEGQVLLLMPNGAVSIHDNKRDEVIGFGNKDPIIDYTDTVAILHEFVVGVDSGESDAYLIHVLVPNIDGGSSAYYYDLDENGMAYVDQLIDLLSRVSTGKRDSPR